MVLSPPSCTGYCAQTCVYETNLPYLVARRTPWQNLPAISRTTCRSNSGYFPPTSHYRRKTWIVHKHATYNLSTAFQNEHPNRHGKNLQKSKAGSGPTRSPSTRSPRRPWTIPSKTPRTTLPQPLLNLISIVLQRCRPFADRRLTI